MKISTLWLGVIKSVSQLAFLALCTTIAVADATDVSGINEQPTGLYTWTQSELDNLIPPAPKRNSAQDKKDYAELLQRQKSRTPAQCAKGAEQVVVTVGTFYGGENGVLSPKEVQHLLPLFHRLAGETNYVIQLEKRKWGRPRPYEVDQRLNPCAHRETTKAYPSGHAAIAKLFENALIELYPNRAKRIKELSQEIGNTRITIGVHHPSDIHAGRILGDLVYKKLKTSNAFAAWLTDAKNASVSAAL